ncbi:hypothetical protein AFM11_10355 [Mycolicibacterium wolinskyi]|uniref:Uncharacterized protein n=1 Tax=Mycolicibacterium wolinskyi TaxID=59750 RepID=A0A132PQ14_9MYCO|nr:hypothetical protein AFM11_10355 [Mycolicibacterium wolinskyi]
MIRHRPLSLLTILSQRRLPSSSQSVSEKLGGLATRPRRRQLCTMSGWPAATKEEVDDGVGSAPPAVVIS